MWDTITMVLFAVNVAAIALLFKSIFFDKAKNDFGLTSKSMQRGEIPPWELQFWAEREVERKQAEQERIKKTMLEIIEEKLGKEKKPITDATTGNDINDDLFAEPQKKGVTKIAVEPPKKQHVELNEENIKIIKQLAEIKKQDVEEKHEKLIKELALEEGQRKKLEEGKKKVEAVWKDAKEKEWHGTF